MYELSTGDKHSLLNPKPLVIHLHQIAGCPETGLVFHTPNGITQLKRLPFSALALIPCTGTSHGVRFHLGVRHPQGLKEWIVCVLPAPSDFIGFFGGIILAEYV